MAEGREHDAREAANNVLAIEHADGLRESVAQLAGAEHGERAPDRRSA